MSTVHHIEHMPGDRVEVPNQAISLGELDAVRGESGQSGLQFALQVEGATRFVLIEHQQFATFSTAEKLLYAIGHAATFRQSKEHYARYLRTVANKYRPVKDEAIDDEAITDIASFLHSEGLIDTQAGRYQLLPAGLVWLERGAAEDEEALPQPPITIAPLSLPRSRETPHGFDTAQHERNIATACSYQDRDLQILAELEVYGGVLTTPNVPATFARFVGQTLGISLSNDACRASYKRLLEQKLVSHDRATKTVSLTAKGHSQIALLKTYMHHRPEQVKQKTYIGNAALKILDVMLQETMPEAGTLSPTSQEPARWYYSQDTEENIYGLLARQVNQSPDTVRRRFDELCLPEFQYAEKGLVDGLPMKGRVTVAGIARVLEFRHQQRLESAMPVIDEEEAEYVQSHIAARAKQAERRGWHVAAQRLRSRYEYRSPFDMTPTEFANEMTLVKQLGSYKTQQALLEAVHELEPIVELPLTA